MRSQVPQYAFLRVLCPAHIIADTQFFQRFSDAGGADIAKFQSAEQTDEPFCAEVEPLGSVRIQHLTGAVCSDFICEGKMCIRDRM